MRAQIPQLDQVQGCLLGAMIGDAIGMPWETMTPQEILNATSGKGVTGFADPVQRKIVDTLNLKAGDTTDDWQLIRAVAKSLIRKGHFDVNDMAHAHVEAFEASIFGWGGTTTDSVKKMRDCLTTHGTILDSKTGKLLYDPVVSCGTGVAMKVAPLACFETVRGNLFHYRIALVDKFGSLTHGDPSAALCAWVLGSVIAYTLNNPRSGDLSKSLDRPLAILEEIDELGAGLNESGEKLLKNLQDLKAGEWKHIVPGFTAFDAVPFALRIFFAYSDNFEKGILTAVNAGGDSDTVTSMVGSLIGANVGYQFGIPRDWATFRPEFKEALSLSFQLYDAAITARRRDK